MLEWRSMYRRAGTTQTRTRRRLLWVSVAAICLYVGQRFFDADERDAAKAELARASYRSPSPDGAFEAALVFRYRSVPQHRSYRVVLVEHGTGELCDVLSLRSESGDATIRWVGTRRFEIVDQWASWYEGAEEFTPIRFSGGEVVNFRVCRH